MRLFNLLALAIIFSISTFAQDGKAILPTWEKGLSSTNNKTVTYLSNISNETVTFYISMFDVDGNTYLETTETGSTNIRVTGGISGDPTLTSGATLGPGESGTVVFENGSFYRGFGNIRWTSTENIQVALIATMLNVITSSTSDVYARSFFPVNEGLPF